MGKRLILIAFFLLGLWVGSIMFLSETVSDSRSQEKLEGCVVSANEMGLDPNDDERFKYIKNCYND